MTDNRTDGMLVPVIDVKGRTTIVFQPCQLGEIYFLRRAMIAGRRAGRKGRLGIIRKCRQAKSSSNHPQKEMRPEVASTKLSPARQHSTHVMFHLRFTVIILFLRSDITINAPLHQ
jgi:hypothetical protein